MTGIMVLMCGLTNESGGLARVELVLDKPCLGDVDDIFILLKIKNIRRADLLFIALRLITEIRPKQGNICYTVFYSLNLKLLFGRTTKSIPMCKGLSSYFVP